MTIELIEKHADHFSMSALTTLMAEEAGPCLSIYLSTQEIDQERVQQPIRLRNLLDVAETQLVELGTRAPVAREILAPLRDLVEDERFWRFQSQGLAIFLTPNSFRYYRVPLALEEQVVTGSRFYVKPLFPLLTGDGLFYLLTLTQEKVQLWQGSRLSLTEVEFPIDTPTSLSEELRFDETENQVHFHTSTGRASADGRRDAMYFGHGNAGDEAIRKEQLLTFFRHLDNGVRERIQEGGQAPLLLVGIEYLQGLYRQVNQYEFLFEPNIEKDPESLDKTALHEQAWALVAPHFDQERHTALEYYHHLLGTEDARAAHGLSSVIPAAYFQRVDTLFVDIGVEKWGHFRPEENAVVIHEVAEPEDEELLDFAVVHTLLNGGNVYMVTAETLPNNEPLAAIFRY